MKIPNSYSAVTFPITVYYPDGSCDSYDSCEDLELNLEFFDPEVDKGCKVYDADGHAVCLKVDKLQIKILKVFTP